MLTLRIDERAEVSGKDLGHRDIVDEAILEGRLEVEVKAKVDSLITKNDFGIGRQNAGQDALLWETDNAADRIMRELNTRIIVRELHHRRIGTEIDTEPKSCYRLGLMLGNFDHFLGFLLHFGSRLLGRLRRTLTLGLLYLRHKNPSLIINGSSSERLQRFGARSILRSYKTTYR